MRKKILLTFLSVNVLKNAKADSKVRISGTQFTLVSTSGKDYESVYVVVPEPNFDSELYAGASNTGWTAFKVKTDDSNPLLTYGRKYDGTGGELGLK